MKLNFKRYFTTAFLLVLVGFAVTYLSCESCSSLPQRFWKFGAFHSSLWVFLWVGNDIIGSAVGQAMPWIKHPVKSFITGMASTVIYSILAALLIVTFFDKVVGVAVINDLPGFLFSSLMFTLVISLFMHGRAFLLGWRSSAISAERLERENILAKYDNLKSQVNPHFLFNSLNVLTNLVYEDQDQAAKFIKQLSEVYRYVLDTREKELVTLDEELTFLQSYLFLQKIRFGDKLKVEIKIVDLKTYVAPLVLQMLAENAIKHNIISEEKPLTIKFYAKGDFLMVENNFQFKRTTPDSSPGIGLENIRNRYKFLSDKEIEVMKTESSFIVRVPFLKEDS